MNKLLFAFILITCCYSTTMATSHQAPPADEPRKSYLKGDVLDIELRDPGTLDKFIAPDEEKQVRCIRLSGAINGDDIKVIKRIAGRSSAKDENGRSIDNYLDLELERVRIVGGGKSYSSKTEHDVIGRSAFSYCNCLRYVSLPRMIKLIDDEAFEGCVKLREVRFMSRTDLREIGDEAFRGCSSLTRINLPDGVESLGDRCFYGCTSLIRLDIPNYVRSIGKEAFYEAPLSSIRLPYGLTDMGSNALSETRIASLLIPAGLKVENDAFGHLPSLREFQVERGNRYYTTEDGVLYDNTGTILLCYPCARGGSFAVPQGVETISNGAFYKCNSLNAVTFPQSLGGIGSSAFEECSSLREIVVPASVNAIGARSFYGCNKLTSATLQANVASLPERVFQDCSSLRSVTLPNGLTKIGESAFESCKSLLTLSGANSLASIGKNAFKKCGFQEMQLPNGVTTIGENAFRDCKSLKSVTLPAALTIVEKELFRGCENLTLVTFPAHALTVGENAFRDCKSLASVVLPEGLTTINNNAFRGTALTQLTLPSSVINIGEKIVEKCKMQSITCLAITPPALKKISEKKTPLYVPAGSVAAYQTTKPWKDFKNIFPLNQ